MADLSDLDLTSLSQPAVAPPVGGQVVSGPIPEQAIPNPAPVQPNPNPSPTPITPPSPPTVQSSMRSSEEIVAVAPHPTTNRYPWPAVENPTVPISQPVALPPTPPVQAPQPVPIPAPVNNVQLPPAPPRDMQTPPAVPAPQMPILTHTPVTLTPPASAIPALALPIHPQELRSPLPSPVQEMSQPAPPQIELQTEPLPSPLTDQTAVLPTQPHKTRRGRPVHVYSDYTREVWRVFRPSKAVRYLLLGLMLLVILGVAALWISSGASTNVMEWPVLRRVLHAE